MQWSIKGTGGRSGRPIVLLINSVHIGKEEGRGALKMQLTARPMVALRASFLFAFAIQPRSSESESWNSRLRSDFGVCGVFRNGGGLIVPNLIRLSLLYSLNYRCVDRYRTVADYIMMILPAS